jgi:anti-sigma B factor antagonist
MNWSVHRFEIAQRPSPEGWNRVEVAGELDVATAPTLRQRLVALRLCRAAVHLDLSAVSFIDLIALQVLIGGVEEARLADQRFRIRQASEAVMRLVDLVGVGERLWPELELEPGRVESQLQQDPSRRRLHPAA